ncbi:MAG: NAD(P)-dependent oxidoreductase [Candidatus Latescibacteria bacterium]|nr:NAD(P)-dependent oxidoreductase [Candidatus Latescibacterota bacterium]
MIIVDTALAKREAEGRPLRVGLIGAGYMGRGIALHFLEPLPGMRLAAVSNRTIGDAARAYLQGGIEDTRSVSNVKDLEVAIAAGKPAITDDAMLLCQADGIDVLIESTGEIEFGAHVAMEAIRHRKHVVLMNAEMDATIGPILKVHADRHGVVITNTDGDEPGVAMNLVRFVRGVGYRPVAAGNLKGMIDPYRTPETQKAFAEKYHQKPRMITSFADGTKLSMECTILSNATGFRVGRRGMYGPKCAHVKEAIGAFPVEQLMSDGLVDYLLGAEPHTGAWVLAHTENPIKRQYMNYFKMGDGPLYVFYTPYHLPHVQIVDTVARAGLFGDATVAPIGAPVCDVLTVAKKDLTTGETLDGIGGFTCYGTIDNAEIVQHEALLPMGLSEGCKLKRDVPKDQAIRVEDVVFPSGRLCDTLREEQDRHFAVNR